MLQSLIKTNPKHAPGWVAAAWLENVAGKSVQARKIIAQGCEHCAKNEDVWIAASELNVSLFLNPSESPDVLNILLPADQR